MKKYEKDFVWIWFYTYFGGDLNSSGFKLKSIIVQYIRQWFVGKVVKWMFCLYDDIKIYLQIHKRELWQLFKDDLIGSWCTENHMSLNANKCQIITTKNRTTIDYDYNLRRMTLDGVRVVYLGRLSAYFDSCLSFRQHYDYIINKSYKILGFIFLTAKSFKNQQPWIILYNALVRDILEYCSSVWFPIYNTHIDHIDYVQRRFLRMRAF